MIKNSGIILVVFLCLWACQKVDKASKPEVVIGKQKMVELLTEIAFVKASKSAFSKKLEKNKFDPEQYILKKHGIDSAVFAQNNDWYSGNLSTYERIFKKVKSNLKKEKEKYDKLMKIEDSIQEVKDSIKRAKQKLEKDKLLKKTQNLSKKKKKLKKSAKTSSEKEE